MEHDLIILFKCIQNIYNHLVSVYNVTMLAVAEIKEKNLNQRRIISGNCKR